MIPNNITYEAGFKSQFFTIVLISGFLIFGVWSLTKLIINLSKNEENQKKLNIFYQNIVNLLNYYLDDLKYIENAIKFFQKNIRHKQVYESVAVEDGLLTPIVEKKTIYCAEYYQKVVEKHKADKELYSEISIYLTLSNGVTLNYIPKYPWYWDGVELFTGIQPNAKKVYNHDYLSPDYVPNFNIIESSENKCVGYGNQTVKTEQEAEWMGQNMSTSSENSDEQKKFSTLLLTKNNSLSIVTPSSSSLIEINNEEGNKDHVYQHETVHVEIDTTNNSNVSYKKEENKILLDSSSIEYSSIPHSTEKQSSNNNILDSSNSNQISNNNIKRQLKNSKSTPNFKNEKIENLKNEKSNTSSPLRKTKSLPNLNKNDKNQNKQKFLKKLKHKKQPKIIYPSIPVNPDLSFIPLYEKNINESKIKSRVKHSDMENTYKRLKVKQQKTLSKK